MHCEQRKNIVKVVTTNDFDQLQTFCKDYVSKSCKKKIKYPKKLAQQIKALGERGISDGDEENPDEEIDLMDDDKEEL